MKRVAFIVLSLLGCSVALGEHVVVITAIRRDEPLVDVPVAVTVLGSEQLKDSGVSDIRELTGLASGLQFQMPGGASDSSLRSRGIGTASTNPGLESSVGVVIDGVARARTGVALSELGDLERIEVLRGPQATLFGRNASAGLINVVTKDPSLRAREEHLEGTVGAYQNLRLAASMNAPLTARAALRLEASTERRNGFYEDGNSGTQLDDIDRQFVRAKLRWHVSRNLSWLFSADFSNRDESCCVAVLSRAGPTVGSLNALASARGELGYASTDPFDRQAVISGGRNNQEDVMDWGAAAKGDLDLPWGRLTSITAWRSWQAWRSQDFDHSGADLGFFARDGLHQRFDVFSQELTSRGQAGRLDWLAGVFFSSEDALYDSAYRMGADYPLFYGGSSTFQPTTLASFTPGDGARGVGKQNARDLSIFTHDVYRLTDRLKLTGGLRYTDNRKAIDYYGENFNPACDSAIATFDSAGITRFCAPFWDSRFDPAGDSDARTEAAVTGTLNIAYKFAPQIGGYLAYSRGYKSGGYQFDRAGFTTPARPDAKDLSFRMETVKALEAGLKTESASGDFNATLTLFREEFAGLQLIENTGARFVARSLAEAITQGAELEVAWRPFPGVTVTSGLSYTDARYPRNIANLAYSGRKMEQAPEWVNVTSVTWRFPLGRSLAGSAYLDNRYSSDFFTSGFDENRLQRAFSVTNARFSIRGTRWSFDLWSRNLFGTHYYRRVFPATFQPGSYSAFLGDPRTYGVTFGRDF